MKNRIKTILASQCDLIRFVILVVAIVVINYIAMNFDLIKKYGWLIDSAQIIDNNYLIVLVFIVIMIFIGFTYKNKSSLIDFLKKVLIVYFIICAEAHFITNQKFDDDFFILVIFSLGIRFREACKKRNIVKYNFSSNTYLPVNKSKYLFESRRNQQLTLLGLIQDEIQIENGISICINGTWGSGKTSFVNCTLDELDKNEINYEEIRINALELENSTDLIKYYFSRIKEILIKHNAYVGVNSEYQSLIHNFMKSTMNENIADHLKSFFSEDEDYRNMISRISEMISEILVDSRIIIIVDDVERCSHEKIKQFLFFIKEVATMKRCVSLFLIENNIVMDVICPGNQKEFLDKFFDVVLSLKNITVSENAARFKDEDFSELIDDTVNFYSKLINDKEQEKIKKEDDKLEKRISELKSDFSEINIAFTNPRRLKKIYDNYCSYQNMLEKKKNELINAKEITDKEFKLYCKNINITKQFFIVAVLNDRFPDIFKYISDNSLVEVKKLISEECWIGDYIYHELFPLISDYNTVCKLRFTESIIQNNYDRIKGLIKPYSSEYDEYKNSIYNGRIPEQDGKKISIYDCFSVLIGPRELDRDLIKKMFGLYRGTVSYDEALSIFQNSSINYSLTIPVKEFVEIFCITTSRIDDSEKCKNLFKSIYPKILRVLIGFYNYKLYFSFLDNVSEKINEEEIFNYDDLEGSVNGYITVVSSVLEIQLEYSDPIERMYELLNKIESRYNQKSYPINNPDFVLAKKISISAIENIKALFSINHFINSYDNKDSAEEKSILEIIQKVRNRLSDIKKENALSEKSAYIDEYDYMIEKVKNKGLSDVEYDEYIKMICELASSNEIIMAIKARKSILNNDKIPSN